MFDGALDILSEAAQIKRRALEREKGVQGPRSGRKVNASAPAHVSSMDVQPTETTNHRFPRAAYNVI